jgi:ribonuclease D
LRSLRKLFAFEEKSILDLGNVAKRHGMKQTGVRNLAALFLGSRIPKGTKTSNWAAAQLSPQQITYAATDAWACRELYLRFRDLGLLDEKTLAEETTLAEEKKLAGEKRLAITGPSG